MTLTIHLVCDIKNLIKSCLHLIVQILANCVVRIGRVENLIEDFILINHVSNLTFRSCLKSDISIMSQI
jgi:hypothetical protein